MLDIRRTSEVSLGIINGTKVEQKYPSDVSKKFRSSNFVLLSYTHLYQPQLACSSNELFGSNLVTPSNCLN